MIIVNILIFLIVLSIIVVLHELGHFFFARKAGILVHEFSVGMGPLLYQKQKNNIKYSFRAIPLGGYVSMSGESVEESMVKEGQSIGLKINDAGMVKAIILDETYQADVYGTVIDADLYGKDLAPLYIKLLSNQGTVVEYQVLRDAKYLFKTKKDMMITPHESSFEAKGWWARFITIFAGPLMNFVLAFILLFMVAIISGKPQTGTEMAKTAYFEKGDIVQTVEGAAVSNFSEIITEIKKHTDGTVKMTVLRDGKTETVDLPIVFAFQSLGFSSDATQSGVYIGTVGGRAKSAGLKKGDQLVTMTFKDSQETITIQSWKDVIDYVTGKDGGVVTLTILRAGKEEKITYDVLKNSTLKELGTAAIGFSADIKTISKFDLGHVFVYPFTQMGKDMGSMFKTLGLLFNPSSGVGVGDLSGPIGIFSLVENATKQGFVSLLVFMAFLSVNIGLINLLPIPALDGGRICFLLYEAVTRKKPNRKFENTLNNIFFILLLVLMVYVAFNDVLRLW